MSADLSPLAPPGEPGLRRRLFDVGRERRDPLGRAAWAGFSFLLAVQSPAAAGRRRAAAWGWLRGQSARRKGEWLEVEVGGAVMRCPPSSAIGPLLAACGTHEAVEDALAHALTSPGDLVVDAGAHIGSFGLRLAGRRVVFVEPEPLTAEVLRANVAASADVVEGEVIEAAVGSVAGRASFSVDRDVQNQIVPEGSAGSVEVEMVTVDAIRRERGPVTLLKLDLEGFDLEGLLGASDTLAGDRPYVLVETTGGGLTIRDHLDRAGYECAWYDWRRRRLWRIPDGWAGNHDFHSNLLAVPRERLAEVADSVATYDAPGYWRSTAPRPRSFPPALD